jgi:hypothetical protein
MKHHSKRTPRSEAWANEALATSATVIRHNAQRVAPKSMLGFPLVVNLALAASIGILLALGV